MAYKQIKPFNQPAAGKVYGECLKNVRLGYGIASKYPTAISAWLHAKQHTDRNIPVGIDVPLYYSYGSDGHVNVRLANGTVWSDGKIYSSLDSYLNSHSSVHYLGWAEDVDGIAVLQYVADPKPAMPLPPSGGRVHLDAGQVRTTFRAGTAIVAGHIHVKDNTYTYVVRGHDPKFANRIIINSASGGGNGVSLALYYLSGARIAGWEQV